MKITINLTNGKSVSAFVDEETVEYLNENIMEESCYDDESEITDYDYVDSALMLSNLECVYIFDKEIDFDTFDDIPDSENNLQAYFTNLAEAYHSSLDDMSDMP